MLVIAIPFGGGGSPSPFPELVVQLAAIALLCASLRAPRPHEAGATIDWLVLAGAVAIVALPLLQLVPLPPAWWQALPGREIEAQALGLIGAADSWRPLTLLPARTTASLLSLLPPIAMLVLTARLSVSERSRLLPLLAALGCVSALLGALQLAAGESGAFRLYGTGNSGYLNGFQANRNQQADVLLVSMLALAAAARLERQRLRAAATRAIVLLLLLMLAFAVVLTGSRTGTALVAVAAAGCALILRNILFGADAGRGRARGGLLVAAAAALVAVGGGAVALRGNAMLAHTWARFHAKQEGRTNEIWPDAVFAMRRYWPAGTGVGTFVPVFEIDERLEVVDDTVANRAHNDYLEYAIEAGIAGVLLAAAIVVGAAFRAGAILFREGDERRRVHALFALFAGIVLALHSIVDYPMRSMALAVIAALAVGLISRVARSPDVRA